MSETLYQLEVYKNDTDRVGVEALPLPNTSFPFQSWHKKNKKYVFVPNERDMIKSIYK
jgi:hypothetical protein